MQLTTTLNKIRACSPCASGWKTLTTALGGIDSYGGDTTINLLTILATNGVADMLWCLRAADQDSRKIAPQLAIEFALDTLPIFEVKCPADNRPRAAIQAAKDFNSGLITCEQLHAARRDAAYAAAYAAAAAADVADVADVAADVAYVAAYAARQKARDRQATVIRSILEK